MNVHKSENVIPYDVDDTLIMWEKSSLTSGIPILDPTDGKTVYVVPHKPHIKMLRRHAARGFTIIVWSQSGYQWAEAVVKALGLEDVVAEVFTKPSTYVDDLPVSEWMNERVYLKPDSNWGQE